MIDPSKTARSEVNRGDACEEQTSGTKEELDKKARSALKKEKTAEQTKGSKNSEIWSQSLVLTKREGSPKGKTMTKSFVYCFEMQFSFGEKIPGKLIDSPNVLNCSVAFPRTCQRVDTLQRIPCNCIPVTTLS